MRTPHRLSAAQEPRRTRAREKGVSNRGSNGFYRLLRLSLRAPERLFGSLVVIPWDPKNAQRADGWIDSCRVRSTRGVDLGVEDGGGGGRVDLVCVLRRDRRDRGSDSQREGK